MIQSRDIWIFDLDNTLYPAECNLFTAVSARMTRFIAERFHINDQEARRLQTDYFRRHGTTLRGLMTEKGISPDEFLAFVHDVDFTPLVPDIRLKAALEALPGRKFIHTNGSRAYAERVLDCLHLNGIFNAIFDICDAEFLPKPDASGYRKLAEIHGILPSRAVMVEDISRNLLPAAEMGMVTAWITNDSPWGRDGGCGDHIHYHVADLADWLMTVVEAPRQGAASG